MSSAVSSTNEGSRLPAGVEILGSYGKEYAHLLTPKALSFVAELARLYTGRVEALLAQRSARQARYDAGERPDFLESTRRVREREWKVAHLPEDLLDRRVEITGPPERKMIINALNSGANCFMADFEDSSAPTWSNMLDGQLHLFDAIRRQIDFTDEARGKEYRLNEDLATLLVRPRGWHLWEKHVTVDGNPVPAGIFDFGLYFFHNVRELLQRGTGPYFYLPKMEGHLEARLWNDVFLASQKMMGIPKGTIKATVLLETLPAAFAMDEILFELRDHSAGLNCGRWDYIFSFIKVIRNDPKAVLPNRGEIGMQQPCMEAYSQLVIKTCHRRGVHAMGGMAAQIPIKGDTERNERALNKVRADKEREVRNGHDGTWVAHPALVPLAREVFDAHMKGPNQIELQREDVVGDRDLLLKIPEGERTEAGLRENVNVGLLYLEAWLRGRGCVPLYNLMEDAATAEISRTQIWQWIRHGATLDDGRVVSVELFSQILKEELGVIEETVGSEAFTNGKFKEAVKLFTELSTSSTFEEFLTLPAYEQLLTTQ